MQQPTAPPVDPAERRRRAIGPLRSSRAALPPMTLAFVAALLLMAIVQFAASGIQWREGQLATAPIDWALGAKVPSLVAHGEYWRLVTANFLHGSWQHLLLNLLGLWAVGRIIESFYGPARMFVIFVLTMVAGTAASYLFTPAVSLGASTGIMGLMGALVWHNWKYRDFLPTRLNYVYPLLLALVAFQFVLDQIQPEVDAFGHLGGFSAGLGVAMLLESRVSGEDQGERDWLPLPTALATAAGLLVYGGIGLALALPGEMALLRAGNTDNVTLQTELIRSVAATRPYFTEARLQYALQLLQLGKNGDAVREYQSAIASNPALSETAYGVFVRDTVVTRYLALAVALDQAGRPDIALATYQQALQLDPAPRIAAQARNNYAWLLVDRIKGDLVVAERYAVRANEDQPENPVYLDTLAWIYLKQQRLEKALATQLQAVERAEKEPNMAGVKDSLGELYYHLGAIYEHMEKHTEARSFYTKALEKKPGYPEAQAGLDRLSDPDDEPPSRPTTGGTMI
jgi:membrane associated rhomboid family serine protease/Flp pilus assembly protein TadD